MQVELEERDNYLTQSKSTIAQLEQKCKNFQADLEKMTAKKTKYHHQYDKYEKMSKRLEAEKKALEVK